MEHIGKKKVKFNNHYLSNYDTYKLLIIYGKIQYAVLLFKIPMVTGKDFFEIYRQFGPAPPKRSASPALYIATVRRGLCTIREIL